MRKGGAEDNKMEQRSENAIEGKPEGGGEGVN
jgi:hypothetical protein